MICNWKNTMENMDDPLQGSSKSPIYVKVEIGGETVFAGPLDPLAVGPDKDEHNSASYLSSIELLEDTLQDRPTVQLCIGTKSEFPDEEDKADESVLQFSSIAKIEFVDENGEADVGEDDANHPFQLSSVANFEAIDEYENGNDNDGENSDYSQTATRKIQQPTECADKVWPTKQPTKCVQNLKCELCDQQFSKKSNLNRHMRIHTGEKAHQCSICDTQFDLKRSLTEHMSVHMHILKIEKPFQCVKCDMQFASTKKLTEHMILHTDEKYQCLICEKKFTAKKYLYEHLKNHRSEKYNNSESSKLRFACGLCDMKCSSKVNLDAHVLKIHHLRPKTSFKCTVCDKGFAAKKNLAGHIRGVHGEKTFKCDVCDKRFALAYSLKNHMEIHRPIFQGSFTEKPASSEFQQVVLVNFPTLVLVAPPIDPLSLESCVEPSDSRTKYWPPAEREISEDEPIFAEAWDCQTSSGTEEHESQVNVDPVFVESFVESPYSKTY